MHNGNIRALSSRYINRSRRLISRSRQARTSWLPFRHASCAFRNRHHPQTGFPERMRGDGSP
jgi:hypothetical protein